MSRVLGALRRANATRRPEHSTHLRVTVLIAVLVAVLMGWVSGAATTPPSVFALLLLPVGAWVSHRRRAEDNHWIKLALAVGAVLLLWQFFGQLGTAATIEDTRAPLATLFLGVQVLHGFDLPQRRDLGFTLVSSLAIVALAGTTSNSNLFGVMILVYAAIAAATLVAMQRSAAREHADDLLAEGPDRYELQVSTSEPIPAAVATRGTALDLPRRLWRTGSRSAVSVLPLLGPVLGVGLLVFLLLPRAGSTGLRDFPFRGIPGLNITSGLVTNPGLADDGRGVRSADDPPPDFNPAAYFGFAEYVDLRTVGELSDAPVMRVRSARPRLWRGMVFDTYTGVGWTRSSDAEDAVEARGLPVRLPDPDGVEPTATARLAQTVELVSDTPNLIFGAAEPRSIFLAGRSVRRFPDGTIVTAQLMEEETIYSVISEVTVTPPDILRTRDGTVPGDVSGRYTQLPADVPQRVRDLAAGITMGAATPYRKAELVQAWLGDNTSYTLDAPPPGRRDPVDHFLFESRAGWCEPIASSMVVMLRSQGVPARFVTGFQPGTRNPLTGVWDVSMNQAHAWVEVWIPREGWIAFDPTGAVPFALSDATVSNIPLVEIGRWIAASVSDLVPQGMKDAFQTTAESLRSHPVTSSLIATAALAAGVGAGLWRRRRRAELTTADLTPFGRAEALLAGRGLPKEPWQTPREYLAAVLRRRPDLPEGALGQLLADEEHRRYADASGHSAENEPAAEEALRELREHLESTPARSEVQFTARA